MLSKHQENDWFLKVQTNCQPNCQPEHVEKTTGEGEGVLKVQTTSKPNCKPNFADTVQGIFHALLVLNRLELRRRLR